MPGSAEEPKGSGPGPRYVALIGDIVGSREAEDRADLQERFREAVERVNDFYEMLPNSSSGPGKLVSPLVVTTGDEFQGLFGSPKAAVGAAGFVSDWMAPYTLRFGLGYGPLETEVNEDQAIGMDGPCFQRARRALERAEAEDGWLRIRGFGDLDHDLGHLADPIGVLRSRWTDRQAEFIRTLRRLNEPLGWARQKDVAQELDVSESTVSESLGAAAYSTVKDAEAGLRGLLHGAVERSRSARGEAR